MNATDILKNISVFMGPAAVFLTVFVVGLVARNIILSRLVKLASNTKTNVDDIVIKSISKPFIIWCLMLALYIALALSKLPAEWIAVSGKTLLVLGLFSVMITLANIVSGMLRTYSARLQGASPTSSITENITRIVIYAIGILVILNNLGISITPILATLGVGGLAVALALQDTLSNLFSGFYITINRQVKIGDYIKLESGEEGYVVDINWRTTKIRMLPNNMVLVPNAKLTQAIITNFCLPEKEMAVLVNLGVHYDSDLKKVERVTCEVGKEVMKEVTGGVPTFDPFIRYHTFADFSINFTVILRAKEFVDQYMVKHEFVKRLHERYAKEGINIPYPIRAINYTQEKAQVKEMGS